MRYPVNYVAITQGYHVGKCLDFGWNALHGGKNVPIYAVADGTIYSVEKQPAGGNVIYIKHTDGKCSCYAHLSKVSVKKGQAVKLGQQIGNMGATGTASGNHLHFGLYTSVSVRYKNSTLDPFAYLELYSDQTVGNTTQKNYGNKIKKHVETKVKTVNAKPCLRVRNKASILGKQVGTVAYGEKVTVYEEKNGWSKISSNSEQWVSSQYLK